MFVKTVTYKGHTIQQDAFGKWHITSMPWGDGAGEWPHFSALAKAKTFVEKRASEQPLAALDKRDALRSSLRVLLDWCETFLNDDKHLIGSICKEADDLQFRAAIKQAREALS